MRTTVNSIREIIYSRSEDKVINSIAQQANRLMNEHLSTDDLPKDRLTDIETWLTAHFLAVSKDRQAEQEKIGEASVKYQGKFDKFLHSTTYGQMVLTLDTTGKLANLGKGHANMTAL